MFSITHTKLRSTLIRYYGKLVELIPINKALMQIIKEMILMNQIGIDVQEKEDGDHVSWNASEGHKQ